MNQIIPTPSLKRLPMYYRELIRAIDSGIRYMNSSQLGKVLGIPSTQVRKDLSYVADQGRPGVGYNTRSLADTLENFLGLPQPKNAVLAGVGNLANALILFPGFRHYGIHILYLFDNDPGKIGQELAGRPIYDIHDMAEIIHEQHIPIGIISTPSAAAQQVADTMIEGGVKSIWNFAPITVHATRNVFVLNQDLTVEMAILSFSTLHSDE
ncbi:MAG: redox-sensing transcriptional repressor Rex [Anaerolineae bacterium]|nr:redox-sensing transcriptional repressor Rex [Anaerolineae bacterium]